MIENIGKALLSANAKTMEEAMEVKYEDGTINDYIIAKTANIIPRTFIYISPMCLMWMKYSIILVINQ